MRRQYRPILFDGAAIELTYIPVNGLFVREIFHTTDSFLKATFELTHTTDSFLKATTDIVHTTDSLLKATFQLAHSTDSFLSALPGTFISVQVMVPTVIKASVVIPFVVVVFDGFIFADADAVPLCSVYKYTPAGPLFLQSTPVLVKRPATTGLYDGSFTPDAIGVGGAPDTYMVCADVILGVDSRRWSEVTMAIGPCS